MKGTRFVSTPAAETTSRGSSKLMDKVLITDAALESLIVHACLSVEGVESMWKGLKEHFPCWDRGGHEPHGVNITRSGLELTLEVFLVGRFGMDLRKLAGSVRGAVAKEVEASTPYRRRASLTHGDDSGSSEPPALARDSAAGPVQSGAGQRLV